MFSLERADALRLQGVTVTIVNPGQTPSNALIGHRNRRETCHGINARRFRNACPVSFRCMDHYVDHCVDQLD